MSTAPPRPRPLLVTAVLGLACVEIAGFGPERSLATALPYVQDAETSSGPGRCDGERPPIRNRFKKPNTADCDATDDPLAGRQSISLDNEATLLCDPCWEATGGLSARFLFRAVARANYAALPFTPVFADDRGDPLQPIEGPLLVWTDGESEGAGLRVHCARGGARSALAPLPPGETRLVTFHYDAASGSGALWVQGPDAGGPEGPPAASLVCPAAGRISGFLARGNVKPAPGGGRFELDDLRVSADPPK